MSTETQVQRTIPRIQAELATAKARLHKLMPDVEAERKKVAQRAAKIAQAQQQWKVANPDEPFDPDSFSPPLRPIAVHDALNREFHQAHYDVAGLEEELEALIGPGPKAKAKGGDKR